LFSLSEVIFGLTSSKKRAQIYSVRLKSAIFAETFFKKIFP